MKPIEITAIWGNRQELRKELDKLKDPQAYRRLLAIIWMIEGKSRKEILAECNIHRNTLTTWIHQFNEGGIEALFDKIPEGPSSMFSDQDNIVIIDLITHYPRDLGYQFSNWTLALLAREIRHKLEKEIGISGLSKHLTRLNIRRVMPHSIPAKADQKKREIQERSEICNTTDNALGQIPLFR